MDLCSSSSEHSLQERDTNINLGSFSGEIVLSLHLYLMTHFNWDSTGIFLGIVINSQKHHSLNDKLDGYITHMENHTSE